MTPHKHDLRISPHKFFFCFLFFYQTPCNLKKKVETHNNLAIALYFSVLSLVVEGINNEMFTACQKMEVI